MTARHFNWRTGILIAALLTLALPVSAQELQEVKINGSPAGREMQDATRQSIARAYARAWETLGDALEQNRADLLDSAFLGTARQNFAQLIRHQEKSGIRQKYIDRGHKIDLLFYSPEGMSVQLRDRAQLEIEVLDGNSVIHRERMTVNYIALLTPTEVTWKVRYLQAVPE
jgi:hypothetical protein